MPYPVSVKTAVKITNEMIGAVAEAATKGRLANAVDILMEYISADMAMDALASLEDMLADPKPPRVPRTPKELLEMWDTLKATPIKEGAPK